MNRDQDSGTLDRGAVQRRFDTAAAGFDNADFVHRHAAAGLFDRMSLMLVNVERILDAGAATGAASRLLAARYRKSRVVSLDLSFHMLKEAKSRRSRFSRITELQADAARLPLKEGSIDLVFANMLLPWCDDFPGLFAGIARVLRKDGLFVFSTLGPDSLRELRDAWLTVDRQAHVNAFVDMHDIGDILVQAGFREPVLDVDYLNVVYRSSSALFRDLTRAGARNSLRRRQHTLTGTRRFRDMREELERSFRGDSLQLGLELVFGHAWGGGPLRPAGEYRLDVSEIGRRYR